MAILLVAILPETAAPPNGSMRPSARMAPARSPRFVASWRFAVVAFALLAATQLAIDAFHAPASLRTGTTGGSLFDGRFLRERGPTTFVVSALPAGSPLAAAGVAAGDHVRFDAPLGRWYATRVGEPVSLTAIRGAESRRITIAPAAREAPPFSMANYVLDALTRLAALAIAVWIGWRRPDAAAFRWLALGGLFVACPFPYFAPASAHVGALDFVASVAQELSLAAMMFFEINYPDDRPTGWRAILKRWYPWYFGAFAAVTVGFFARLYAGFFEPAASLLFRFNAIALPILFLATLVSAWWAAHGETRIRMRWILASLGTIMVTSLLGNLNATAGNPVDPELAALLLNAAIAVGLAIFAYAVMRHRIFDFGLAVNRTLVFAIVGAILLAIFQVANRLVGTFLHFDDELKSLLLTAILAGAVYLSFTHLRKVVERVVDRVFFRRWADREDDLKRFVAEAKHVRDPDTLSALTVAALDRYTEAAGAALYRRDDDGSHRRVHATLADAPERLGPNDGIVLAMLAHRRASRLRERAPASPADLAVPMVQRADLDGLVLLGPRSDGEPYRADQVEQLEAAMHQVALDFHALRVQGLEDDLETLRRAAEVLRAQLATAVAVSRKA
jgi:hypothetical protein